MVSKPLAPRHARVIITREHAQGTRREKAGVHVCTCGGGIRTYSVCTYIRVARLRSKNDRLAWRDGHLRLQRGGSPHEQLSANGRALAPA